TTRPTPCSASPTSFCSRSWSASRHGTSTSSGRCRTSSRRSSATPRFQSTTRRIPLRSTRRRRSRACTGCCAPIASSGARRRLFRISSRGSSSIWTRCGRRRGIVS
ncbi:hypothetical protein K4K56_000360, partial [Colletotrichum sp. SAR 10_98]